MMANRSRVIKPAMALWLVVLATGTAAAGGATMPLYLVAGVLMLALVIVEARALTARRRPHPVRVRRSDQRSHSRRYPGRSR
jgi:hypothetical protein